MSNPKDANEPITLVTGASGFLASHIVQQLLQKGQKVRGTVRDVKNEAKVKPLRELSTNTEHLLELIEADLLDKESWVKAVEGCTYVCHVASPCPISEPEDKMEIIKPAVDGTKAVLEACANSGTVKRVCLTSSILAIQAGFDKPNGTTITEENWTDLSKASTYAQSKTMAEKVAWEYVQSLPESKKFELVALNPGVILGPVITGTTCSSIEIIVKLMARQIPAIPNLSFAIVDIRDVATAHIIGLTSPKAAGNRYILVSENMWMIDMAKELSKEFNHQGYNVPTRRVPYFLLWTMSWFDKSLKDVLPNISRFSHFSNAKAQVDFGMSFKSSKQALIDMGYSLIERDFVKKTQMFKGRQQ